MTKEPGWDALPGPSVQPGRPQRKRSTGLLASIVTIAVFTSVSLSINFGMLGMGSLVGSSRSAGFNSVPFHAKEILDKCAALKVPAGPPKDFNSRTVSDRYTPGTPSTIIYNARIWTGERNGTEVVDGFVWLENGIVVALGGFEEQERVLEELRTSMKRNSFIKFVDAGWKWVTPGLCEFSFYLCVFWGGIEVYSCDQLTCTHTLELEVPQFSSVCRYGELVSLGPTSASRFRKRQQSQRSNYSVVEEYRRLQYPR